MMQFRFHALTDTGLVRSNNEDALDFDATHGVAVLADGMGGYNAGEVASSMAVLAVMTELVRSLKLNGSPQSSERLSRVIETCFDEANLAIMSAATSNPQYAGMGTTLVVGVFLHKRLILAHVGDSRCYRLRDSVLTQITKDHSMLQEQVDAGFLTQAQAVGAPGKNLLTRALGVEEVVRVDLHEHAVEPGDLYLICSDGLTDMMTDKQITLVLTQRTSLSQMATELVAQCNRNGGWDNISVLLVQADSPAGKIGLIARLFGKA